MIIVWAMGCCFESHSTLGTLWTPMMDPTPLHSVIHNVDCSDIPF